MLDQLWPESLVKVWLHHAKYSQKRTKVVSAGNL